MKLLSLSSGKKKGKKTVKIRTTEGLNDGRLNICVIGASGSGKTSLAKTIFDDLKKEQTFIISAESGLLSIRGAPGIDVFDLSLDDQDQIVSTQFRAKRIEDAFKHLLTKESQAKYKWVFIDSLTEIAQNIVEGLKASTEYGGEKNILKLWGAYSETLRMLIKQFRDLPYYNVVMTVLAEKDKDENGNYFTGPKVQGKISQELPAYFDEVFYLGVSKDAEGNEVRRLLTRATETIIAKDRSGKLDKFEQPNLAYIARKIKGDI